MGEPPIRAGDIDIIGLVLTGIYFFLLSKISLIFHVYQLIYISFNLSHLTIFK